MNSTAIWLLLFILTNVGDIIFSPLFLFVNLFPKLCNYMSRIVFLSFTFTSFLVLRIWPGGMENISKLFILWVIISTEQALCCMHSPRLHFVQYNGKWRLVHFVTYSFFFFYIDTWTTQVHRKLIQPYWFVCLFLPAIFTTENWIFQTGFRYLNSLLCSKHVCSEKVKRRGTTSCY